MFLVLVVAGGDAPEMFDVVEESFNEITSLVEIRAEADRVFSIDFGGMLAQAPRSLARSRITFAS
jgi:hypothetical protein